MIKNAKKYAPKKMDESYVCGLNAFRVVLTMIEDRQKINGGRSKAVR